MPYRGSSDTIDLYDSYCHIVNCHIMRARMVPPNTSLPFQRTTAGPTEREFSRFPRRLFDVRLQGSRGPREGFSRSAGRVLEVRLKADTTYNRFRHRIDFHET